MSISWSKFCFVLIDSSVDVRNVETVCKLAIACTCRRWLASYSTSMKIHRPHDPFQRVLNCLLPDYSFSGASSDKETECIFIGGHHQPGGVYEDLGLWMVAYSPGLRALSASTTYPFPPRLPYPKYDSDAVRPTDTWVSRRNEHFSKRYE